MVPAIWTESLWLGLMSYSDRLHFILDPSRTLVLNRGSQSYKSNKTASYLLHTQFL